MTVRLEPPGGYHSARPQLSRFGNSAEKISAGWNLDIATHPDALHR
ncbi:hypothetical protein [Bradyrhizobium sp.]|jgi:hypothetical protein